MLLPLLLSCLCLPDSLRQRFVFAYTDINAINSVRIVLVLVKIELTVEPSYRFAHIMTAQHNFEILLKTCVHFPLDIIQDN